MVRRRILGIAGSLRARSHNANLLAAAALVAPDDLLLRRYGGQLSDVPLFNEDLENSTEGGLHAVMQLRAAVQNADGILFSTPEYNQSIPGVLKNIIDWLSRDETALEGKPVCIMGASTGPWGTRLAQAALRQTLEAAQCLVMPPPAIYVANAAEKFDVKGNLTDETLRKRLEAQLQRFCAWVDLATTARNGC